MKSLLTLAAAATAILASAAHPAASQEQVGQATLIRTTVTGGAGPLVVKSPVHRDERIRTSNSGLGEFMFRDGTRFAVGRNSSVVIDRFVYDGAKTFNKLTLNAARGSFRWISGKSKSLAAETAPLGIKVTAVAPGPFRTDWAGRSMIQTENRIADYAEITGARLAAVLAQSGKQAGDPVRAGEAMIKLTESENPPLHIVFGAPGLAMVTGELKKELAEIEAWREVGLGTDFPA